MEELVKFLLSLGIPLFCLLLSELFDSLTGGWD